MTRQKEGASLTQVAARPAAKPCMPVRLLSCLIFRDDSLALRNETERSPMKVTQRLESCIETGSDLMRREVRGAFGH
jgi:hypothetical protein